MEKRKPLKTKSLRHQRALIINLSLYQLNGVSCRYEILKSPLY